MIVCQGEQGIEIGGRITVFVCSGGLVEQAAVLQALDSADDGALGHARIGGQPFKRGKRTALLGASGKREVDRQAIGPDLKAKMVYNGVINPELVGSTCIA